MAVLSQSRACFVSLAMGACLSMVSWPLAGQPPAVPTAPQSQPEITIREEKATFTSHVNLVMVPVVVRDKQGRAC